MPPRTRRGTFAFVSVASLSLRHNPHPIFTREDLVSSLQLENERTTFLIRGDGPVSGGIRRRKVIPSTLLADLPLEENEGPEVRRMEPSLAVARWYLRRKTDLEELLLQLYFGRLPMADVETLVFRLWGEVGGVSLVRDLIPNVVTRVDRWLGRPIYQNYPYLYLYAIEFRPRRPEENGIRVAAAVGISAQGYRDPLGIVASAGESVELWDMLLADLGKRGIKAPQLVIARTDDNLRAAVARRWPGCQLMACLLELQQGLAVEARPASTKAATRVVEGLEACSNRTAGKAALRRLQRRLREEGHEVRSNELETKMDEFLAYFNFPQRHWNRLRNAGLVRAELNRVREQMRVIGPITDGRQLVRFAAAGFRRQCRSSWNSKPFLSPDDRAATNGVSPTKDIGSDA